MEAAIELSAITRVGGPRVGGRPVSLLSSSSVKFQNWSYHELAGRAAQNIEVQNATQRTVDGDGNGDSAAAASRAAAMAVAAAAQK